MRDVFERLEQLRVDYYLTGSEALARYGQPRQTMDIYIVIGVSLSEFARVEANFARDYLVNPPIDLSGHLMASVIPLSALGKADLILSRDDALSKSAMERRQRWEHPSYGAIWVISVEDLILAKLDWSAGSSELQLRDCRNLISLNRQTIDWAYLERWAKAIGVSELLETVRSAT